METKYIPAEWEKQSAIVVGFPSHPHLWPGSLLEEAQLEIAALCNRLSEDQTCYVMVANHESQHKAKKMISGKAVIQMFDFGDIWFRDIAPIFKTSQSAIGFKHNGWGHKYLYPFDDSVAKRMSGLYDLEVEFFDVVLEGGALEHNGEGAILTTKECLLHENRNAWDISMAEKFLRHAFHAKKIYWLERGLAFDHTDGHVDNVARFLSKETVLIQTAQGDRDPNKNLFKRLEFELRSQGLQTKSIPSPGLISGRDQAIMPASHLNYVISNNCLIMPNYLKDPFADKKAVAESLEVLRDHFCELDVVTMSANAILSGGGAFHCISQNIPK